MSRRRRTARPGGRSAGRGTGDAECADLRAELAEARAESERLRAELAAERARVSVSPGADAAEGMDASERVPSPVMLADSLDALGLCQQLLETRAQGDISVDEQAVGIALVEVLDQARKVAAMCAAAETEALVGLTRLQHLPDLPAQVSSRSWRRETLVGVETGAVLQVSPQMARGRTEESTVLTTVLTKTLDALWAGRLTEWHVRTLLSETAHLDKELRRRVEDEVLDYACTHTPPELRARVKKVVARLDPIRSKERHARARADRRVWAQPGLDGRGTFGAELPAEDLAALMTAIEAAAAAVKTADPDDGRTMDNRRADALAAMGWTALATGHIGGRSATAGGSTDGGTTNTGGCCDSTTTATDSIDHDTTQLRAEQHKPWQDSAQDQDSRKESAHSSARDGPKRRCCCGAISPESSAAAAAAAEGGLRLQNTRGKPVTVNVTVPYSTLIGIDDHPGELAGYGTITADVARRIAAEGNWRRILTDPVDGAPLDYGRTVYEPPPDLAAFIELRDQTCRMPGCARPARASQLDHTIPFAAGGATAHTNLGALDHVCHLVKTFANWSITQDPDRPGRFDWISPLGFTHRVEPEPVGPIIQDDEPEPGDDPQDDTPPF